MHCYACDKTLINSALPDPPTTRYYCEECFQPTLEEQLRLAGKDYIPDISDESLNIVEEEPHKWSEEENE